MKLKILGSSSKGNSYILDNGTEILLLELGLPIKLIKKGIDFDISKVVGALCSHRHGDHANKSTIQKLILAGVSVFSNEDVQSIYEEVVVLPEKRYTQIGAFSVMPFSLHHDVPNYGYLIKEKSMGCLVFATDTNQIPYHFKNVDHFLIEANFEENILTENLINQKLDLSLLQRIANSHMSIVETCNFIKENLKNKIENICLIHLSGDNSNAELFKKNVEEALGDKTANIYIAKKGLILDLKKYPF